MGKKNRRRSAFSTSTIFKFLRIAALVAPAASRAMGSGSNEWKLRMAIRDYTGYDIGVGQFFWSELAKGWMPFIATCLVTHGIQKLNGIIRRL